MNRQEHLLTIAIEECNELAQRLSKAQRFGMDEKQDDERENPFNMTNKARIYDELYDLRATLGMAGIDAWDASARARTSERLKCEKVEKYLRYSAEQGTLQEK